VTTPLRLPPEIYRTKVTKVFKECERKSDRETYLWIRQPMTIFVGGVVSSHSYFGLHHDTSTLIQKWTPPENSHIHVPPRDDVFTCLTSVGNSVTDCFQLKSHCFHRDHSPEVTPQDIEHLNLPYCGPYTVLLSLTFLLSR
jgi:hypothetical protein